MPNTSETLSISAVITLAVITILIILFVATWHKSRKQEPQTSEVDSDYFRKQGYRHALLSKAPQYPSVKKYTEGYEAGIKKLQIQASKA